MERAYFADASTRRDRDSVAYGNSTGDPAPHNPLMVMHEAKRPGVSQT